MRARDNDALRLKGVKDRNTASRTRRPSQTGCKQMPNFVELLTPKNSQLLFIDQQPQMAFGVQSIDRQTLKNNVVALAKAGKIFNVPTTITTVETESFSGHT